MSRFRYGRWRGGPDPLAGPLDVRRAVDEIGEQVLEGTSVRDAVRNLLRRGTPDTRGLRDLQASVERRRRELRRSGNLRGTLERVRELLQQAVDAEREALSMDDSLEARLAEADLDTLPSDTARAVRALENHEWRSPQAQAAYDEIKQMLRRDVLDQQFAGMRQALEQTANDPESASRLRDMLSDLNSLLSKHARGEDTAEDFQQFMDKYGDLFPNNPQSVDELIDELARQAAAAERFMRSLSPEHREQLQQLISDALADMDLAAELSALRQNLRDLRPGLDWSSPERFTGEQPMSYGEGTEALAELSDLEALADSLAQDHPGATLDDVDVEAVERQLGSQAATDVQQLAELERELRRQGWLTGGPDGLTLSPKALRRLGETALRTVFAQLRSDDRGGHDDRSAGAAGELTGSWRAWRFGDEQPLDAVRTVSNAVLRRARGSRDDGGRPGGRLRLDVEDFAVVETERRSGAALALCVDLSWSMFAEGRWGAMKQTALALDHLISTRYPQDSLEIIGFSLEAAPLTREELATAEPAGVQGTNLQQALALARRHLARHPSSEPVLLVVTDGEPTAHTEPDGYPFFHWPTSGLTLEATLREVDALTRSRIAINTFMLGEEPGLQRFVNALARRNGGRVFSPDPARLGEFVVADYLRARQGMRRAG